MAKPVREVLVILKPEYGTARWYVRMVLSWFPFFIDSKMGYATKKEAEKVAAKWRKKNVQVSYE